jgi:hypothetical protein
VVVLRCALLSFREIIPQAVQEFRLCFGHVGDKRLKDLLGASTRRSRSIFSAVIAAPLSEALVVGIVPSPSARPIIPRGDGSIADKM